MATIPGDFPSIAVRLNSNVTSEGLKSIANRPGLRSLFLKGRAPTADEIRAVSSPTLSRLEINPSQRNAIPPVLDDELLEYIARHCLLIERLAYYDTSIVTEAGVRRYFEILTARPRPEATTTLEAEVAKRGWSPELRDYFINYPHWLKNELTLWTDSDLTEEKAEALDTEFARKPWNIKQFYWFDARARK